MLFEAIDSAAGAQAPARLFRLLHAALRAHIEADRAVLSAAVVRVSRLRPRAIGSCEQALEELEILTLAVADQRAGSVEWRAWLQALRRAYRHHMEQDERLLFVAAAVPPQDVGPRAATAARVRAARLPARDVRARPLLTLVPRAPGPT